MPSARPSGARSHRDARMRAPAAPTLPHDSRRCGAGTPMQIRRDRRPPDTDNRPRLSNKIVTFTPSFRGGTRAKRPASGALVRRSGLQRLPFRNGATGSRQIDSGTRQDLPKARSFLRDSRQIVSAFRAGAAAASLWRGSPEKNLRRIRCSRSPHCRKAQGFLRGFRRVPGNSGRTLSRGASMRRCRQRFASQIPDLCTGDSNTRPLLLAVCRPRAHPCSALPRGRAGVWNPLCRRSAWFSARRIRSPSPGPPRGASSRQDFRR